MTDDPVASARLAALQRIRTDLRYGRDRKDEADEVLGRAMPLLIAAVAAAEQAWWVAYSNRRSPEFITAHRELTGALAELRHFLPPG